MVISTIIIIKIDKILIRLKQTLKIKRTFIMEIIKQNETFNVKDSNEKFEMSVRV